MAWYTLCAISGTLCAMCALCAMCLGTHCVQCMAWYKAARNKNKVICSNVRLSITAEH